MFVQQHSLLVLYLIICFVLREVTLISSFLRALVDREVDLSCHFHR